MQVGKTQVQHTVKNIPLAKQSIQVGDTNERYVDHEQNILEVSK